MKKPREACAERYQWGEAEHKKGTKNAIKMMEIFLGIAMDNQLGLPLTPENQKKFDEAWDKKENNENKNCTCD